MYCPALSVGEDKFDARWKEGVWQGIKAEIGESVIRTRDGVVKARDVRRKPENGGRWNREDFDTFRGVPWEPYPGAGGGCDVRSKVRLPVDPAVFTEIVKGRNEFTRRRFIVRKEDWETFWHTTGCPGCNAVNRGTRATNHLEECRNRLTEEL